MRPRRRKWLPKSLFRHNSQSLHLYPCKRRNLSPNTSINLAVDSNKTSAKFSRANGHLKSMLPRAINQFLQLEPKRKSRSRSNLKS